jgi:hypothetical protein
VSRTYKQFDGYHPIFSYIGREGYMLSCELREGKQHCQNGTPAYLKRTITYQDKGKTVYTGFHTGITPTDEAPHMDIIFEVTLRLVS